MGYNRIYYWTRHMTQEFDNREQKHLRKEKFESKKYQNNDSDFFEEKKIQKKS